MFIFYSTIAGIEVTLHNDGNAPFDSRDTMVCIVNAHWQWGMANERVIEPIVQCRNAVGWSPSPTMQFNEEK